MLDKITTDATNVIIPQNSSCGINPDGSIFVDNTGVTSTYILMGNQWRLQDVSPTPSTGQYLQPCDFIADIESPWDYNIVYYQLAAIVSVGTIFLFCYYFVLHPWWRKRT